MPSWMMTAVWKCAGDKLACSEKGKETGVGGWFTALDWQREDWFIDWGGRLMAGSVRRAELGGWFAVFIPSGGKFKADSSDWLVLRRHLSREKLLDECKQTMDAYRPKQSPKESRDRVCHHPAFVSFSEREVRSNNKLSTPQSPSLCGSLHCQTSLLRP